MALTADTVEKREAQEKRIVDLKKIILEKYPEALPDYLGVTNRAQWLTFIQKYPGFDPNAFPEVIASPPQIEKPQTEPDEINPFQGLFDGGHGGGHGVHTPEVIEEDGKYHKLADEIREGWLISHGQKDFETKEGLDFLYGSLDNPKQRSLDDIAHERFRTQFAQDAINYDKKKAEEQKIIKKKPDEDNAFTKAHERVKEEFAARRKLLDEQAKKELIQLNQAALNERNKQLLEKIEAKEWKKFATNYQEKALAYAPQHAGINNAVKELGFTPTTAPLRPLKQKRENDNLISNIYDQYQNASSVGDFFKKIFLGGEAVPAATEAAVAGGEAALAAGEGIAAATEVAALGEGAVGATAAAVGGEAAAATGAAAGTAAATGTAATAGATAAGATAAGGAAAAGSTAAGAAAVAGGTATAAVGWPVIVIIIIVILIILFLVILFAVIPGILKQEESNTTTTAQIPIPGLTLSLVGPDAIPNSTNITYTIKALYDGSLDVTISDPLPSNTTLVSATGIYTQANNAIVWNLKDNVSTTGTASGVLKDYSFTLVLSPTNPDILVKNKIIATSQSTLTGNMKEILGGNSQPLTGKGLALKGQVDSLLRQYPGNIAVYKEAETATGVPWQVLAGLHYIEGTMRPNVSLVSGRPIGGNEPDVVRSGGCSATSELGKPKPVSGGCGFTSLLDSAVYAGNHLKGKVNNSIATFEDAVAALSRYNGGGNRNCAQPTDAANPRTPWTGCPRQFAGEDDPYVLSNFDTRHENMYLVFCADLTMCNPPRLFGERLGSMTVAKIVADSGN